MRIHHTTAAALSTHSVPRYESSKTQHNVLPGFSGKVTQHLTASTITHALKQATNVNRVLYGSTFKVDPKQLATVLASPTKLKALGYAAMFRADGSQAGSTTGMGWGGSGDPGPHMTVTPVSTSNALVAKVIDNLNAQFEGDTSSQAAAQRRTIDAGARTAMSSMLHEAHTKLYYAHWDNQDDTTIEAAIAVDAKNGEVRVLTLFSPA